jgi:hypothetical protein
LCSETQWIREFDRLLHLQVLLRFQPNSLHRLEQIRLTDNWQIINFLVIHYLQGGIGSLMEIYKTRRKYNIFCFGLFIHRVVKAWTSIESKNLTKSSRHQIPKLLTRNLFYMCIHKANPYFSTAWKYKKCLFIFSATWTKVHQTCSSKVQKEWFWLLVVLESRKGGKWGARFCMLLTSLDRCEFKLV